MKIDVQIGTIDVDALPEGVSAEDLRAAVKESLLTYFKRSGDPADVRAATDDQSNHPHPGESRTLLANAIVEAVAGETAS